LQNFCKKVGKKAEQWLDYAGEPRPCYPKSEVDNVIAEKNKEIDELRNEADVYKAKYEREYDIAVHNVLAS
jgi:uncharacterized coiled-coil DUF342 family protein